jgi:hypothetical protein
MRISYYDRANNDVYTSNFPSIFISDSVNKGIPSEISGSLSRSSSSRGSSTNHYVTMNWPYSSNYNDISEKVVLKVEGGITCCNSFSSMYFDSNRTGSFSLLWRDKVANISVYRTPSITYNYNTKL